MEHRANSAAVDTEPTARVECSEDRGPIHAARAEIRAAIFHLSASDQVVALSAVLSDAVRGLRNDAAASVPNRRAEDAAQERDLTDRQERILDWIATYIDRNAFPPTLREIGTAFRITSTNGVNDHLRALERKGYIARADGPLSRSIRVLRRAS